MAVVPGEGGPCPNILAGNFLTIHNAETFDVNVDYTVYYVGDGDFTKSKAFIPAGQIYRSSYCSIADGRPMAIRVDNVTAA